MELVWAIGGAAALIVVLIVQRKSRALDKATNVVNGLTSVSSTTPGWLAFLKLLWMWCANAAGSLVLWILAVPGSGGGPAFYQIGWFFLIGNSIGVIVTAALFITGRRIVAVQTAKWVVPAIFVALLAYGAVESIVA